VSVLCGASHFVTGLTDLVTRNRPLVLDLSSKQQQEKKASPDVREKGRSTGDVIVTENIFRDILMWYTYKAIRKVRYMRGKNIYLRVQREPSENFPLLLQKSMGEILDPRRTKGADQDHRCF
jgi:hypothetical protein